MSDLGPLNVVVDVQGMQTPDSRHRGVGNYSGMAATSLFRTCAGDRLSLASNRAFPRPEIVVPDHVRWLEYDGLVLASWANGRPDAEGVDEVVRRCWASANPDVVHVSSVFEGFTSGAPVPSPEWPGRTGRPVMSTTVYDLIPMRFPEHYLRDERFASWYAHRCDALRGFDVLFAISEATRKDVIDLLHIDPDRVVTVGGGCDPAYRRLSGDEIESDRLRQAYRIRRDYVLTVTGDEYRKNIPRLIEAYAKLGDAVRGVFDLVVVCHLSEPTRASLETLLGQLPEGVRRGIHLLGYVEQQDLVRLYNDCSLFVFPSFYEGLGIPPIEAMRCGATALVGDNSSLVEVVADPERRFNAMDPDSIAACIQRHLVRTPISEPTRRGNVERSEVWSWDTVARRMLETWRAKSGEPPSHRKGLGCPSPGVGRAERPRLAMFTPLPGVPSGIADYSFEFIPYLARHFAIDVFLGPRDIEFDALPAGVEHVEFYEPHGFDSADYFSSLYEIGNSEFHWHMLPLLNKFPGIVTLHDAYLSGLLHWMQHEIHPDESGAFINAGLRSHGGGFRRALDGDGDEMDAILKWPVSGDVFAAALGVVSHTPFNREVAYRLLGHRVRCPYRIIPHARVLPSLPSAESRQQVRAQLGFDEDDVVITSFGHVSWHKMGDVLVDAFARSRWAEDERAHLVFAGGIAEPHFGDRLAHLIDAHDLAGRVRITGFLEATAYRQYLAATDLAVQLRTNTRGGTSGATLDCVSRAKPVIVNAHGSFDDYPAGAVVKVSGDVNAAELAGVLDRYPSREYREIGEFGRRFVATRHDPEACAAAYATFIRDCVENADYLAARACAQRIGAAMRRRSSVCDGHEAAALAQELVRQDQVPAVRQLLIDVSRTYAERREHRTGIQRVVRGVAREALRSERINLDVRLIARNGNHLSFGVDDFESEIGSVPTPTGSQSIPVACGPQDTLLLLDFDLDVFRSSAALLGEWKERGGRLVTVVYDLIPLLHPDHVPPGASVVFEEWLRAAVEVSDGVVCISRPVADDVVRFVESVAPPIGSGLEVGYWRLGMTEIFDARCQPGASPDHDELTFLMVSTVEPRKGHGMALDAFERIWAAGGRHRLRIIGRLGWSSEGLAQRIRRHPRFGSELLWDSSVTDAELARAYGEADVLLIASEAEGHGLPLDEALSFGLPVIARDLPVFRDRVAEGLHLFSFNDGFCLSAIVQDWAASARLSPQMLRPSTPNPYGWSESVEGLLNVAVDGLTYRRLRP